MNRLNKIILSFVLPILCLLISVSNAEWNSTPSTFITEKSATLPSNFGGYTLSQIAGLYGSSDIDAFNNMVSEVSDAGYYFVYMPYTNYTNRITLVFSKSSSVDIGATVSDSGTMIMGAYIDEGSEFYYYLNGKSYASLCTSSGSFFATNNSTLTLDTFNTNVESNKYYYGNFPYIKNLIYAGASYSYTWDGTYVYETSSNAEPPIVEDLQLKKIIDELFTSNTFLSFPDSWRNNFFIIYNKDSNTYEIIVAPDYVYFRGYKYIKNESDYYRMLAGSSPNFDIYDFSNLVNNSYTEYTNPLGSFNFYKFIYECDEEGNIINRYNRTFNNMTSDKTEYLTENQILVYTRRNIPFYTLNTDGSFFEDTTSSLPSTELKDENGEIIVITPPKQPQDEIINDADFGDLSNSFEEHKSIFSFTENMQWLISANNKLSNYFLGFIVMCALFITLGRVLKG